MILVVDAELQASHFRVQKRGLPLAVSQRFTSLIDVALDPLFELIKSFLGPVFSGTLILNHWLNLELPDSDLVFMSWRVTESATGLAFTRLLVLIYLGDEDCFTLSINSLKAIAIIVIFFFHHILYFDLVLN